MTELTLNKARVIVRKALAHAQAAGMKPLSIVVLDHGGHPVAFERADGGFPGGYVVAHGKAYAAVMMGLTGSEFEGIAKQAPNFANNLNELFGGAMLPVRGGVLVKNRRGMVIGAVGATGDTSENDVAAAVSGIEAAGFVAAA